MHGTTLVFDLDGTLVDTAPDLIAATNHALASIGLPPVGASILRTRIGSGARSMVVEALLTSGRPANDDEVDKLLNVFLAYYSANIADTSRPYPHVVETLERLKAAGAKLAVCTNKRSPLAESLLRTLDLERFFVAVAGRNTFPVSKPHPDHLLGTIKMAGGDPRSSIMIGDSDIDVATAKAAEVPIVAVTFGYNNRPIAEYAPDQVIDGFDELEAALAAIQTRGKVAASGKHLIEHR